MYRQILVAEEHKRYQRILWRQEGSCEIKTYELNTVTAPASFLAVRCLHQLAVEAIDTYPLGSEIILRDFYMDDLLTGANSKDQICCMKCEISSILEAGGFCLQKWACNDVSLLADIPRQTMTTVLHLDKDETLIRVVMEFRKGLFSVFNPSNRR